MRLRLISNLSSMPIFSLRLMLVSCNPQVEELKLQCGQFLKSTEGINIPNFFTTFSIVDSLTERMIKKVCLAKRFSFLPNTIFFLQISFHLLV